MDDKKQISSKYYKKSKKKNCPACGRIFRTIFSFKYCSACREKYNDTDDLCLIYKKKQKPYEIRKCLKCDDKFKSYNQKRMCTLCGFKNAEITDEVFSSLY